MPPRFQTPLTKLLSVRVPIVLAPMAGASGGALAAAVHQGGGFGFIAAGHTPPGHLIKEIAVARSALSLPASAPLPLGIGLLLWRLEAPHGDPALAQAFLNVVLDAKPAAIWLSFGADFGGWVKRIRGMEKERGGPRSKIFIMIGSKEAGLEARGLDIDVVVAQGTESGGHGANATTGLPLLSLLAALYPAFPPSTSPLLVAAGGIQSAQHLLAVLPFAAGAVMGTAFLASPESLYSLAQRELLLRSSGEDTVRTMRFDEARGTIGWGDKVDGRGLRNATSEENEADQERKDKYDEALKKGDVGRIVTWAGTSVGGLTEIRPAAEIVRRLEGEALEGLDAMLKMRVGSLL